MLKIIYMTNLEKTNCNISLKPSSSSKNANNQDFYLFGLWIESKNWINLVVIVFIPSHQLDSNV